MRRQSATRSPSPRPSRCSSTVTSTLCTATRNDANRADARPWLLGIAANLLRRHWRSERRRLDAYARSAGFEAGGDLAPPVAAELAAALRALPRREREPLLLLAWADLSYEEIGVALCV